MSAFGIDKEEGEGFDAFHTPSQIEIKISDLDSARYGSPDLDFLHVETSHQVMGPKAKE